jgi:cellulose synthase/poly-beta-1,6-N-acetylglucosamine synthase-like glycosyltransferase
MGGKILLADDVPSKYFSRGKLKKLLKQYYQYVFYTVRVFQKHPRQMSLRQFFPPRSLLNPRLQKMNKLPFVSLVLPVRNEAAYIEKSLHSVLNQNYPRDRFEVIVANGLSNDKTGQILISIKGRYPNLQIIDNPGRIVPTGLNSCHSNRQR